MGFFLVGCDLDGDMTCLRTATSLDWTSGPLGPIGMMDCGRDGIWRVEILPFDHDGHGRDIHSVSQCQ